MISFNFRLGSSDTNNARTLAYARITRVTDGVTNTSRAGFVAGSYGMLSSSTTVLLLAGDLVEFFIYHPFGSPTPMNINSRFYTVVALIGHSTFSSWPWP